MIGYFKHASSLKILFAALVAIALLWSPAEAKKKKKKKAPKAEKHLLISTQLGITYDDNILRYSDNDLDLYDISPDSSRFAIDSKNDWIITPKISSRYKGKLAGHTAWIGAYFHYYFYAKNDVRRFSKIGFFGRQYYRRGGYVEFDYYYIPDYYYRNQYFQSRFIKASFAKHSLVIETGLAISKSLKGDLSYRYQKKTFNREVSERDLQVHIGKLNGVWQATGKLKFWAIYSLQSAKAAGADIADIGVKDVSYDAWDITIGSRFYTRGLGRFRPELTGSVQFRQIKYQTIKYLDVYRFGRKDHNMKYYVGTTWHLPAKVRFDIGYSYQSKNVKLPVPALESILEYNANSVSIDISRNF